LENSRNEIRSITDVKIYVEEIIDNPDLLDKIPNGTSVTFLDGENVKPEKRINKGTAKKYIKVKRHFEVL